MGKFTYAILLVFIVELSLWLFGGTSYSNSSLFNLLTDPSTLMTSSWYAIITIALAAFAGSAFIIGNLYSINIYALYAGIGTAFIGFALSIVHLWSFINGQLVAVDPKLALVVSALITAPLLIYYIISITEWVRSNQ